MTGQEILALVRADRLRKQKEIGQLTLGQMLDQLDKLPADTPTTFSLSSAHSYRGYYEDLGVYVARESSTVGEVRSFLFHVLNSIHEGYKGGKFVMTRTSRVWDACYGVSNGFPITGFKLVKGKLRISKAKGLPS